MNEFELNRIHKYIEQTCDQHQGGLQSLLPEGQDAVATVKASNVDRFKLSGRIVITFQIHWPKLKDKNMEYTGDQAAFTTKDIQDLINMQNEIVIKETLDSSFGPFVRSLQDFIHEYK